MRNHSSQMQYFRYFRTFCRHSRGNLVAADTIFYTFRAISCAISSPSWTVWFARKYCDSANADLDVKVYNGHVTEEDVVSDLTSSNYVDAKTRKCRRLVQRKKSVVDFRNVDADLLPTVILVGRPNVGKSALFNRLIQRREALVYNTPDDHVTRNFREGIAKLGDLRFKVLDSAGLETAATSGSILSRTADMTHSVLSRSQFALFLIDVRDRLQPLDHEVGKWLRKHTSGIRTILVMNKSESLDDQSGVLLAAAGEAQALGFGDPILISAETGLGMVELYEALCLLLEEYMLQSTAEDKSIENSEDTLPGAVDTKVPLQLTIVGRPNVGKSKSEFWLDQRLA